MNNWPPETYRTLATVVVLLLLLTWESLAPFYMHKVHHSDWQPETDSNYSSLFSFWDRVFGSFRLRDDPRSVHFGLQELATPEDQTLKGLLATPFRAVSAHARTKPN
jgi:sterol desaturase/sphingolipid hydroxylase (fatty acid hydroxylase superfamily)